MPALRYIFYALNQEPRESVKTIEPHAATPLSEASLSMALHVTPLRDLLFHPPIEHWHHNEG